MQDFSIKVCSPLHRKMMQFDLRTFFKRVIQPPRICVFLFFSGKSPDDTVRSGHEKILMGFSGYKFLVEFARFFTVNFEDEFLFPRVRYVSSLGGNPQWWRFKWIAGGFAECQGGRAVRELEAGKLREGFFLEADVRRMRMFQHQGNLRYLFNILSRPY